MHLEEAEDPVKVAGAEAGVEEVEGPASETPRKIIQQPNKNL